MHATEARPGLFIRNISPPLRLADFKLVAFDMDSTLINIECVDQIADMAGRGDAGRGHHRGHDARRDRRLQGQPAPSRGDAGGGRRRRAAAGVQRTLAAERRRGPLRQGLPDGRLEDAAGVGRVHVLQRAHPPAPEARLRACEHARRLQRPAHRHAVRQALGRHRRWRREEACAARGVRADGHRHATGDRRRRRRQRPADDAGRRAVDRLPSEAGACAKRRWCRSWKAAWIERSNCSALEGCAGESAALARTGCNR